MLRYGDGLADTSSVVTSIEFDKDGDLFAVAGVAKKIMVRDRNMERERERVLYFFHPYCL